jgi:hypothetical protein
MGDAAEKLYDDLMKLPESERRALARRVLERAPEPRPVRVGAIEPLPKPEIEATPEEILALAAAVYEGLSEDEIREIEAISLDRSSFFRRAG